jgi:hypothetical protein
MIGGPAAADGAGLEQKPWLFHGLSEGQARRARAVEGRSSGSSATPFGLIDQRKNLLTY